MKQELALLVVFLFFGLPLNISSQTIAIYSDDGSWHDGIIAIESFCDDNGFLSKRVYSDALNKSESLSECSAICFPGGYAYDYKTALTINGLNYIRSFINNGGAYIGICAGAFFASSSVDWEGETYPYQLKLFDGIASGSIHSIAKWDDHTMTSIKINQNSSITAGLKETYKVLYYGGPYFTSNPGFQFDTIAVWSDYYDLPSIICFEYGNGRVCLIGPHLEIEENSNRDNTDFAFDLDDVESDWELLNHIFIWATDKNSIVPYNYDVLKQFINIFPNPTERYINFSFSDELINSFFVVELFNVYGEKVISEKISENKQMIDTGNLPGGMYYIILKNAINVIGHTSKIIILQK
jgi:glutamine amidotransferase-like uncharacterized protein